MAKRKPTHVLINDFGQVRRVKRTELVDYLRLFSSDDPSLADPPQGTDIGRITVHIARLTPGEARDVADDLEGK